jgi:hypothetical protein
LQGKASDRALGDEAGSGPRVRMLFEVPLTTSATCPPR